MPRGKQDETEVASEVVEAPAASEAPNGTAEDQRAAQVAEYGTWVAACAIFENGARAYNEGDPVPCSNVERLGYERDGLVRRAGQ